MHLRLEIGLKPLKTVYKSWGKGEKILLRFSITGNNLIEELYSTHYVLKENKSLRLPPHKQFVFTMPKLLRPYFKHDRKLFADVSKVIHSIISEYYGEFTKNEIIYYREYYFIPGLRRYDETQSPLALCNHGRRIDR